jgi:uncharacterized membrane protein YebE (DUF533 family)
MENNTETIIKSLIAVAWADGRVGDEERELIDTVLEAYELAEEDAGRIREWASSHKSLDQIDFGGLAEGDRFLLLQQAVYVTYIDGVQTDDELALLRDLAARIGIDASRAGELIRITTERAKALRAEEQAAAS